MWKGKEENRRERERETQEVGHKRKLNEGGRKTEGQEEKEGENGRTKRGRG